MRQDLALDEARVSYYRVVADFALLVGSGADLAVLIEGAAHVRNPALAALVPQLTVLPACFTADELQTMAIAAEECASVRKLLAAHLARHCLRADVLKCVANYFQRAA